MKEKLDKRDVRAKQFRKTTKNGQPIMKYRVNDIYEKVKSMVKGDSK
jgi:rRNA processing